MTAHMSGNCNLTLLPASPGASITELLQVVLSSSGLDALERQSTLCKRQRGEAELCYLLGIQHFELQSA